MYKATVKSLPKRIDAVEYAGKTFTLDQEVEVTNAEKDVLSQLAGYEFSFTEVESGSKKTPKSKSSSSAMDNVEGDVSPTVPNVEAAADTLSTT
jgi:hypothetical protein